jgi:hypothetical protein
MYRYVFFRSESGLIFSGKTTGIAPQTILRGATLRLEEWGNFLRVLTVCEKHRAGCETYSIFFKEIPANKMWDVPGAFSPAV